MNPDASFLALFEKTSEFTPGDKEYPAYKGFNLGAIDRGRVVVERLSRQKALKGARVLDVGCGSGGLAIAIAEAGAVVDAIEPDPVRIAWAQARIAGHGAKVDLHEAAAEDLPFPDSTFSVVTVDSVIEHVADAAATIREVARVLEPHGIAYFVSPNKASLINILHDPHYQMFGVVLMPEPVGRFYVERIRRHERGYWVNLIPTKRWLQRTIGEAGLTFEQIVPDEFAKLSNPSEIRYLPARRAATVAGRLGLGGVLPRLALAQYPAIVFIARKPR